MKIMHYSEAEAKQFDSDQVKRVTGRIAIGKADGANNFCMRIFEIEKGGFSPRHTHDWEHEIFIHEGRGEAFCDGSWEPISAGTVLFIPGNEAHQIRNTGDGKLVFACLIPSGVPEL